MIARCLAVNEGGKMSWICDERERWVVGERRWEWGREIEEYRCSRDISHLDVVIKVGWCQ
jgi:hypothetical protein